MVHPTAYGRVSPGVPGGGLGDKVDAVHTNPITTAPAATHETATTNAVAALPGADSAIGCIGGAGCTLTRCRASWSVGEVAEMGSYSRIADPSLPIRRIGPVAGYEERANGEDGTGHERHYSVEEANALLPSVKPLLRKLRDAKDLLTDTEAHEALSDAAPSNGGGEPGRRVGEAFLEVRTLLGTLQEAGIVVRDIDRGLIDFPAIRDGEEVYLCWELGEDAVEHWHDLESGYRGRRELD